MVSTPLPHGRSRPPRLPRAFDGYRILHISDPHFDAAEGLGEAIVRTVTGAEVDLCVLTGDFRTAERGRFTEIGILEPLAALHRGVRATDGFLATLGNHDAADMVPHFRRLGLLVLINQTHHVRRDDQAIALTGLDDVHSYYTPAADAALAAHDPATFGIVLAHSPEMAGEAAAAGYDMYLCGHCHGGQLCLPGGRPLITHLSRHRNLYAGPWRPAKCGATPAAAPGSRTRRSDSTAGARSPSSACARISAKRPTGGVSR